MRQTIEAGRSFVGKIKEGIKSITTPPPDEIAFARGVTSGEIELTPEEVANYRQSLTKINALQSLGTDFMGRQVPQTQSIVYSSWTEEDWQRDYRRYLTNIVRDDDNKQSKKSH